MANFTDVVYPNAFQDLTHYHDADDAVLDTDVTWPQAFGQGPGAAALARNMVNRFYALINQGGPNPSRERFRAWNNVLNVDTNCMLQKIRCNAPKANGQRCTRIFAAGLPLCFQHSISTFGVKLGRTLLLDVNNGRLPMLGVFACRRNLPPFQNGDLIAPYIGDILTNEQLNAIYPGNASAPYGLSIGRNNRPNKENVDSACIRGLGAYVNSAPEEFIPTAAEHDTMAQSDSSNTRASVNGGQPQVTRSNCELVVVLTEIIDGVPVVGHPGQTSRTGVSPQPWLRATRQIMNGEELYAPILNYNGAGPDDLNETRRQNLGRTSCNLNNNP